MIRSTGTLILLLFTITAFGQESILKDYAENRNEFKFCLYPSTLRMINLKKDSEFNELVNGIEKLLIYRLETRSSDDGKHTSWTKDYINEGYEEYMSMSGIVNLIILGKEDEYVGLTGDDKAVIAFYLRGEIAFQKIPKLIQTFEGGDMLNLISNQLDRSGK